MVIDAHTHVGLLSITSGDDVVASKDRPRLEEVDVDYEVRERIMDQNDIDGAVIMPSFNYDRSDGIDSNRRVNDWLGDVERDHERLVAAVGTVEPCYDVEVVTDELERIADMGFRAVGWHHRFQGTPIDDPTTLSCLERLEDLDMVAFVHCYSPVSNLEHLDRLPTLAERTDQPIVVLDAMHHLDNIQKIVDLGTRYDNLYFDTALLISIGRPIEVLVEEIGADRIVFGTDFYADPLMYRRSSDLFQIRTARISDADRELILEGNVRRLLDI